ncbi:FAD-binding domain-containing protein [Tuber magnatum]|uniref:FAD-binding domain-containing protein n=1 Tax=Tuber magnatum TaxID=42249 RepID=A0A317SM82_9PEZI|nr:FAD-binding domain-containing protein [Tuber magnatum]
MTFQNIIKTLATLSAIYGVNVAAFPTANCCSLLEATLPGRILSIGTADYATVNHDFWSSTTVLSPGCIFSPTSPREVARAVKLFTDNQCKFAVRGGGHSAVPGAANTNDGVLIVTEGLNERTVTNDDSVWIGAGNTWGPLYDFLGPYRKAVVAGRYYPVGTGLLLGAGLSFFGNELGLAVDNVKTYEVVLYNGTIVHANATSHPDLHRALKGGGDNFGVITRYELMTNNLPDWIWGGMVYYNESQLSQVEDVVYDYHVDKAVNDVKTHVLPQFGFNGTTNETANFSPIFYNGALNSTPAALQPWLDAQPYRNTMRQAQMVDLAREFNAGFGYGLVQVQRTFTIYADKQFFRDVWYQFQVWLQGYRHIPGFYGLHCNMPVTPNAVQEGVRNGGNVLGLEDAGDRTLSILYFGLTFNNLSDTAEVFPAFANFVESMIRLAEQRGVRHRYIMWSYAGHDQRVIESYGERNNEFLRRVREAYDPAGTFTNLVTGGFKLPARRY